MTDQVDLVLASRSLRRAELLRAAGFVFEIAPADVDERSAPGETPGDYVQRVAAAKAAAVARRNSGRVVLGADTTVVLDARALGKPADDNEARSMLRSLSGRVHEVLTGVVLQLDDRVLAEVVATSVRFWPLSEEEIAWYVASGEPAGKAGAYAIQGLASRFVERIDGSYSNVVGLPIAAVYRLHVRLGRERQASAERSR